MVNYYISFKKMVKQQDLNNKKIPYKEFEQKIMIHFGFGGRNKAMYRWIKNFKDVDYITLIKENDKSYVKINIGE